MFKLIFKKDITEYYYYKGEKHYFKAFEHTSHEFFTISGFIADEYNMEKPNFYLVPGGQFQGMNPYSKPASEIYMNMAIQLELHPNNILKRCFNVIIILLVGLFL